MGTINTPTKTVKTRRPGDTSKAKEQVAKDLDIEFVQLRDNMSICWVPFPMTDQQRDVMTLVSDSRSTDTKTEKVSSILSKMLRTSFDKSYPALVKESETVAKKEVKEKTDEDLLKEAERAQKKYELMMSELKARQAGKK